MAVSTIVDSIGSLQLLDLPKTAFLCSRTVSAGIVLKCYDWAIAQREAGNCVISGFHSTIEKDVFHYLRKGDQPIIIVLHHGIGVRIQSDLSDDLNKGRLLIISPFEKAKRRGDVRSAETRNKLMIGLAERVVVGYASQGGQLEKLITSTAKPVEFV
jgi:predicted Rossmann fold nucleotide-binding protein DprA/Smf involved in DNA uptake